MGRKPKAGGAEGKTTGPEQSERFLEAAREAGVDEAGEAFERAFERVVRQGRPTPPSNAKGAKAPRKPRTTPA